MSKPPKSSGPVHEAVLRGSGDALAQSIEGGASVDALDREKRTALLYAAKDNRADFIAVLLQAGADVNVRDKDGWTALHFAAQSFAIQAAAALIAAGAVVDAQDDNGNTPLFRAVFESRGRAEMIELLVRAGADRGLKNRHDVSPAELADSIGNYDVSSILARL